MRIKAIFKGRNGSCGFIIYDLELNRNMCQGIPYGSVESFLKNWIVIPEQDLTTYCRNQKIKRILK